ncbi:MAG: bacillithiol biosynthesis cysteine-adding enzyme BshC, partial [Bacteroidota bacterium]|nr:bacillithiol biosynthesis cysteine-adding enzyme BshC [Bacteroidota bacterium]
PFGNNIIQIFKRCYRPGITIQQATLELVNELFGKWGVIVLIPDNAGLKRLLSETFSKEIEEQFSHKEVEKTVTQLSQHYKVQAGGREVNLFYLLDDKRERIEKEGCDFIVQNQNLRFTKDELLNELQQYPERFSPNVILRGVMQETVLPNVAFIGGGGELAYWLELKGVFGAAKVPYPVLVLRNSFLFFTKKQDKKIKELGFTASDFFKDDLALLNELTDRISGNKINIDEEKTEITLLFQKLQLLVEKVDVTLREHTQALSTATQNKLTALQTKILRAERRKYDTEMRQIQTLQQQLFPHKNLQERVENLSGWYARYDKAFIENIYLHSLSLEQQFAIITL